MIGVGNQVAGRVDQVRGQTDIDHNGPAADADFVAVSVGAEATARFRGDAVATLSAVSS